MGLVCAVCGGKKVKDDELEEVVEALPISESSVSSNDNVALLEITGVNIEVHTPTQQLHSPDGKWDDRLMSSRFSTLRDSYRKPNLGYTPSVVQTVKFNIGNELLCMSWNLNHESENTPFDFYSDFRTMGLKEYDTVLIEIVWDVARVLLFTDIPTQLCQKTVLSSCVSPFLLSFDTCRKFCDAANVTNAERVKVMDYPNTSLCDFLLAHSYNGDNSNLLRNEFSFFVLNKKSRERKTRAQRLNYDSKIHVRLLENDPKLLPLIILDSLHVLAIRLSVFLIDNQLRMAFSEYSVDEQISELTDFVQQKGLEDLSLPDKFKNARRRLYKKWRKAFQDCNKIQQLWLKASQAQTDIILLQQLSPLAFGELRSKFAEEWEIFPSEFPPHEDETTAICLRKTTVTAEDAEIRRLNNQNFAVLCKSSDIRFYVAVVHLTEGEGCGQQREKEVLQFHRILGKRTPTIVGGDFNEDLTGYENTIAKLMLSKYNGIDHTQEIPLAFSLTRTRTNLQCDIIMASKQKSGVDDGIFSSFPLVGEAFTDFLHSGFENPSDHGPVFQRVLLGLF